MALGNAGPVLMSAHRRGRRWRSRAGRSDACASYARYSSDHQRETSIPDQQRKCQEAADRNRHVISPELQFGDEAVSGTKLRRKGLDAMLEAAKAGLFSVLYFYNLSRLARESVITMPLLKQLVYVYGVRVISVTEGMDTDRDGWEMVATIFSVVHERFIKDLSDAVFRGQESAILARFAVGDHCFGYTSVPIPGSEKGRRGRNAKPRRAYAIDEVAASWVRRIFHWFVVECRAIRWIARELNRLGAPTDHRATKKKWHPQQVARLLANPKYVGIWPWGERKNDRNPLTGQVFQDERPAEECEKWTRRFEELRIISDELREKALARLKENQAQLANRHQDGRLSGARLGEAPPRHLLSRLLHCKCSARFQVSGANGKYLRCPNWANGVCDVKTEVRRDLAERLVLEQIGAQILANPSWHQAVYEETLASWREGNARRPGELDQAKKALAEIDRKIAHLVNSIENGNDSPEVRSRLAERRKEREALVTTIEGLERAGQRQPQQPPTLEWVAEKITNLTDVLRSATPAAALTLRDLVGGKILVREIREANRKRFRTEGRFVIDTAQVRQSLGISSRSEAQGAGPSATRQEIVLEFSEPDPALMIAEKVKSLWDAGMTYREIAAEVGRNRNLVAEALAHWHRQRGLEVPDGRSYRQRLNRSSLAEQLADRAKDLWDEGLLIHEIAGRLECNHDTATAAIRHWFDSRGQPILDGRTRRKGLSRKSSTDDPPPHAGPAENAPK